MNITIRLLIMWLIVISVTLGQSTSEMTMRQKRAARNAATVARQAAVVGEWYEVGQLPMYAVGGTWSSRLYLVGGDFNCEYKVEFKDNRNNTRQTITFRPKNYSYSWNESILRQDVPNFSGNQTTTGIARVFGRAVTSDCAYPEYSLDVAEVILTQIVEGRRRDLSLSMGSRTQIPYFIADNEDFSGGKGYSYGIALTNNTTSARVINYTLYDYSTGKQLESNTIGTLAANEHIIFALEDKIPSMKNRLLKVELSFEPYESNSVQYVVLKFNSDGSFSEVEPY